MRNILVVEDNPLDFEAVARALRSQTGQFAVHHAATASAALAALRDLEPSLIFLDLRLPGDDGREIMARIRDGLGKRFVPIIILSGSDDPADIQQSYELGASSYCIKEFDQTTFARMISAVCDYWFTWVKLPH